MALPPRDEIDAALLAVLAETGRARPRDVYPRVTRRFPGVTPQDMAATRPDGRYVWQNEIQWARNRLAGSGWLDRSERGWWKLTEAGFREAQDRLDAAADPPAEPAQPTEGGAAPPDEDDMTRPIALAIVPGEAERIAAELGNAARDSGDPNRLERAVGDALAYLGFEVEMIGGPGKTDVLAIAPLGATGYRVVCDAKSTASGPVANAQIDWVSIRDHREHERADHACVVGPAFAAAGQVRDRAAEFDTSLLTAAELAGLVEVHARTPITLAELHPLFESAPLAGAAIPRIEAAAGARARRLRLIARLLERIETLTRFGPDLVFTPDMLFAAVFDRHGPGTGEATLDDVRSALSLLGAVGVLEITADRGYVPRTSRRGALQMLAALGGAPDEQGGGVAASRAECA